MRVVVTAAGSPLGVAIVSRCAALGHTVVASDRRGSSDGTDSELSHPGDVGAAGHSTDELLAGAECVVHLEPYTASTEVAWLDRAGRCTFNVLGAAAAGGVRRVVLVSTMRVIS